MSLTTDYLIIASILKQLWHELDNGAFSPFLDLMLKCMFSCAFFSGFLDVVKLLVKKQTLYIFKKNFDVSFGCNCFVLRLRMSKTDPFSHGVDITIFENDVFKPVNVRLSVNSTETKNSF